MFFLFFVVFPLFFFFWGGFWGLCFFFFWGDFFFPAFLVCGATHVRLRCPISTLFPSNLASIIVPAFPHLDLPCWPKAAPHQRQRSILKHFFTRLASRLTEPPLCQHFEATSFQNALTRLRLSFVNHGPPFRTYFSMKVQS